MQQSAKENTGQKTKNQLTPINANTMQITEASSGHLSEPTESEGTQLMGSKELSERLKVGVLDSMDYCDDAMSELSLRMRGMFQNDPDQAVKTYEPDKVHTAAMCARTIADVIRAKTEAMKLLK